MNNHIANGLDAGVDIAVPAHGPAPLELDVAKYVPHLADFDMTEAQKRELLETLWAILQTFVHLGFDVGKADVCGQIFADFNEAAEGGSHSVALDFPSTQETANGKDSR